MSRRNDHLKLEIPDLVSDPKTKKTYRKGKFLGRGGFAKCYELIDTSNGDIFAGKVIAKSQLTKPDQKSKMTQEIAIHRSIKHNHVVEFMTFFEDKDFIYIVLELCSKRSLMEMHKRRKTLAESEVRYYVKQIALACKYLHDNRIVHRDLKLGNLFLNDNMEIKVGDFGLATKIACEGDRKLTLCGTPNYIAPEVLFKKGHSYEVDVWSLGCIVYTLVVGKPPFETSDLKDTYKRIKSNEYKIPSYVGSDVSAFITKLLQSDPKRRPSMREVLEDPYMNRNYIPSRLPVSCLTVAPRFDGRLSILPDPTAGKFSPRKPLGEMANNGLKSPEKMALKTEDAVTRTKTNPEAIPKDYYLRDLSNQLHHLLNQKPSELPHVLEDEAEDPASSPIFWISKWVDYTDKYGIGYQLCDNSVGVLFNDITKIMLMSDETNMHYIERDGGERYLKFNACPHELYKKLTLLKYFRNYMNEHLLKTGDKPKPRDGDDLVRLPYLNNWFRTRNAIVFHLTNGTVQINFFQDHTKLILCPLMGAVTYVNDKRDFKTYKFSLIEKYGCSKEVFTRVRYACDIVDRLMHHKLSSNTKSGAKR